MVGINSKGESKNKQTSLCAINESTRLPNQLLNLWPQAEHGADRGEGEAKRGQSVADGID